MKKQSREAEKEDEKADKRRRVRRKKIELRESQKKEDIDAQNVREAAKCFVFSMICGSAGSKSRLGKAEVAVETRHGKLHAAVGRSAFSSQNVLLATCSGHFLKF